MDEQLIAGGALDRVYRLAVLAAGSPGAAARLLRRAYARRDPAAPEPEVALARGLLAARPGPWRWQADPARAAHAGLAPAELAALRACLAAATPQARLALGAPHLAGIDITYTLPSAQAAGLEQGAETGSQSKTAVEQLALRQPPRPDAPWPRRAGDHSALLALVARAWGLLPAEATYADVYEQAVLLAGAVPPEQEAALRALLLASTPAAEQVRAVRDGLRRAEARLASALPALFGGEAPVKLRAALTQAAAPQGQRMIDPLMRRRLALVVGVALVSLAVMALPRGRPAPTPVQENAAPATRGPRELVRAALTRLERPVGEGVLHERFVASAPNYDWTLERWQELAPPHRFRVEVRDDEGLLRFALASDGVGLVQQRVTRRDSQGSIEREYAVDRDYKVAPATLTTLLPTLRQQPDGVFMFAGWSGGYNLERYYLNQALDAPLRDLGAAVAVGRPARLLSFTSEAPMPPYPDELETDPEAAPAEVLLALDAATQALLEVRVLPAGGAGAGEVTIPWRAEVYELLDTATAEAFALPPPEGAATVGARLVSPRLLGAEQQLFVELEAAVVGDGAALYYPGDAAGIGYALQLGSDWAVLVHETPEEVLQLIPFTEDTSSFAEGPRSTRQAGVYTYDLVYPDDVPPGLTLSLATVYTDQGRERGMHVVYSHTSLPQGEREARLAELIRSLAPLEAGR